MGGVGSGGRYRIDSKITVEQTSQIDIRYLRRNGLLVPGVSRSLFWSVAGMQKGSVLIQCGDQSLSLKYQLVKASGEVKPITQRIWFEESPCNYGGFRKWFSCPGCGRRVEVLYGYCELFLCRHCYQIPYRSQSEARRGRLLLKKHKLGEKIFSSYEMGQGQGKKKGMHWKTYDRLYDQFKQVEQSYLNS